MWKHRAFFATIMLSSLIALAYSGEDIFLVTTIVLLGMLVFSVVDVLSAAFALKITQTISPNYLVKGDTARLTISIENRSLLPVSFMMLWYDTPDTIIRKVRTVTPLSVSSLGRSVISDDLDCQFRGLYNIGVIKAEIRDIFGLISVRPRVCSGGRIEPLSMLVYPKVVRLQTPEHSAQRLDGQITARNSDIEDMLSIADIRHWREGDPLSRTHWKLSARHLEVMVREFDDVCRNEMCIFVDCSWHGLTGLEALMLEDCMIECAASVCRCFIDAGITVRLTVQTSERLELCGSHADDFGILYSELATVEFGGVSTGADLLSGFEGMNYTLGLVAILQSADSDNTPALSHIAQTGRKVTGIFAQSPEKDLCDNLLNAGVYPLFLGGKDISAACKGVLP